MRPFSVICLILLTLSGCGKTPVVQTVKPAIRTIEATVSGVTSGTVRAEKVAELAFGAVGRVKTLSVKVGDTVQSGAILAEIENQDLISILDTTRRENVRRQQLRASNALAQTDLDQILRDVQMAQVAVEKSKIVAPYDGLIVEQNLEVGQLSQITAVEPLPLIKIVDLGPRYVRAEIDEVDLSRIKVGQRARVRILAIRREPFSASVRKVVQYVSSVREQDRTAEIELTIDGEDGSRFHSCAASWDAAGRRPGYRHRPPRDAADEHANDPRRDPVPAAAPRSEVRLFVVGSSFS